MIYTGENYRSKLPKEVLIYNLIYHLEKCKSKEEIAETVRRIIENSEEEKKKSSK